LPGTSAGASGDTALRCFTCGYNLTGVVSKRCPECGTEFDPVRMREILYGAAEDIPALNRCREIGWLPALLLTAFDSCVHPVRTARRMPINPSTESGWLYSGVCYAAAAALYILASMLSRYSQPEEATIIFIAWGIGVGSCEAVLGLLLAAICAHGRHYPVRYRYYRGLVHLGSIHVVGLALAFVLIAAELSAWQPSGMDPYMRPFWLDFLIILPWLSVGAWLVHMTIMVAALRESIGTVLLTPLVMALSVFLALAPSAGFVMVFGRGL